MGLGGYLAAKSDCEHYESEKRREESEVIEKPHTEAAEVAEANFQAITNTDLPVIVAVVVVASFFIVIANLVVDVLYGVIDPRVRMS